IAGIVAIPVLLTSMPKQASALSVVNPDVQKPLVGTLLARRSQRRRASSVDSWALDNKKSPPRMDSGSLSVLLTTN
ncbi:MAG: hypothetical protein ACYT04_84730, partial [Nostoc sp.]